MTLGLLTVFGAGLLTLFTPCVLPMVPVLLSMLLGSGLDAARSARGRLRLVASTALFVLGFTLVFTLLGMAASSVGQVLAAHRDLLVIVGGAIILVLGLKMLGGIRLAWLDRTLQLPTARTRSFGLNAVLLGVVFGLGWTPCVGPVLGSVLTYTAASTSSSVVGAGYLFSYSLGVGAPLLLVSLAAERVVPAMRSLYRYLPKLERATGGLMVAGAVIVLAPNVWGWVSPVLGAERSFEPRAAVIEPALGEPTSKPRLIEFFSEDCPVCRRMDPVMDQLVQDCVTHGVEILRIDVRQVRHAELSRRFGITAVPAVLGFAPDGTPQQAVYGERSLDELRSMAAGLLGGTCAGQAGRKMFDPSNSAGCGMARADAPARDIDAADVGECREPAL